MSKDQSSWVYQLCGSVLSWYIQTSTTIKTSKTQQKWKHEMQITTIQHWNKPVKVPGRVLGVFGGLEGSLGTLMEGNWQW